MTDPAPIQHIWGVVSHLRSTLPAEAKHAEPPTAKGFVIPPANAANPIEVSAAIDFLNTAGAA